MTSIQVCALVDLFTCYKNFIISVPVCPHAGGVGLCELVQHLSMFDYISVGCSLKNRSVYFLC